MSKSVDREIPGVADERCFIVESLRRVAWQGRWPVTATPVATQKGSCQVGDSHRILSLGGDRGHIITPSLRLISR